jgi:hypothetical protein
MTAIARLLVLIAPLLAVNALAAEQPNVGLDDIAPATLRTWSLTLGTANGWSGCYGR